MARARHAHDVGSAIRAARLAHRMTQAELAARAGVGRQWLVAAERGHDRAELGKITAVLDALGLSMAIEPAPPAPPADRTWLTATDAAEAIRAELIRDDTGFALRVLGRALADLEELDDPEAVAAYLAEPPSTGDHRWDALLAVSVGRRCRQLGLNAPAWTSAEPLPSWWFPVFDPILTARTIQRTPVDFAARGIWLDERALTVL